CTLLTASVVDSTGQVIARLDPPVPLPAVLMPGRALSAAVPVPVPQAPGEYEVRLGARRCDRGEEEPTSPTALPLVVEGDSRLSLSDGCLGILDEVQAALAEANRLQKLPEDYSDI